MTGYCLYLKRNVNVYVFLLIDLNIMEKKKTKKRLLNRGLISIDEHKANDGISQR